MTHGDIAKLAVSEMENPALNGWVYLKDRNQWKKPITENRLMIGAVYGIKEPMKIMVIMYGIQKNYTVANGKIVND